MYLPSNMGASDESYFRVKVSFDFGVLDGNFGKQLPQLGTVE